MSVRAMRVWLATVLAACTMAASTPAQADKVGDLCEVVGVRDNQLIGYGVVTGLNGTGDDISAPFATQSLLAIMRRLGVQIDSSQFRLKNVAAVMVTATIPPFARTGSRIDITISSIGNARSLQGGVLLQTPLYGADMHVYAVGQGALLLGGYDAKGQAASVRTNVTTTARSPGAALIEREIPTRYVKEGVVTLSLRQPDFTTAQRIATAIEAELGKSSAVAADPGAVKVTIPAAQAARPVDVLARIQAIDVSPSSPARVIINERTGTIVASGDVRLSPIAIAQGGITIVITETAKVSQPNALAGGTTAVVPQTDINPIEQGSQPSMTYLDGASSLADVAHALSTLGVTPRELASVLQAMRSAGALRAEVIVQ
ncbi:MAG: flagellar basal body P-ring protein FlgI [Deltaproteobacteria bacterium]|nr:flagellar basal body P-ring protein FlgI [Deltaproteobacteria bacterium]